MPLYVADGSIDHLTLQTVPERYVIFYASEVHGTMWCPVCVLRRSIIVVAKLGSSLGLCERETVD